MQRIQCLAAHQAGALIVGLALGCDPGNDSVPSGLDGELEVAGTLNPSTGAYADEPGDSTGEPQQEEGDEPDPVTSLQSEPSAPAGGCSNVCDIFTAAGPVGCRWEVESTTTLDELDVECTPGFFPISGSCYTNDAGASLQVSMVNEGSIGNVVEDGDLFYNGPNGWTCDWTKSPDSGENHTGAALCCAAVQLTQCSC